MLSLRILLLLLLCLPAFAQAQTRAWLDRDRVALGETATLNIETDQAGVSPPDYAPLEPDFVISGHTSRQSFELRNGVSRSRTLFAAALQPRREGVLAVPSLRVGKTRTAPLSMTVTPAEPARAGGIVFIEAEADQQSPYVQQAVGYVVRLYYATQLISGQLDQEAPPGASLQRVGSDVQYSREIGNRRYTVVERRYLLIPERSGTLAMPPARFQGRGVGGFFDEMFGDGQRALSATGPQRMLDVRAVPANAPQPWLPLQALSLRYAEAPRTARAGDAVDIVVEAVADGANATQMPELQLPVGDGAQVFAEPAQTDETFDGGRPRVKVTRKFSLVPARTGTLRIAGPHIDWWDVRAGRARSASLPELTLQVAAAARGSSSDVVATAASPPEEEDDDGQWLRVPGVQGEVRAWALATVIFALLWLATLMWALHRREPAHATSSGQPADDAKDMPPGSGLRALRHALDVGDLGEVAAALCALATPPANDLDALSSRLDDSTQLRAIAQLQAARWGGGDAATARAAVRAAFAAGPRWRTDPREGKPLLPPLYP